MPKEAGRDFSTPVPKHRITLDTGNYHKFSAHDGGHEQPTLHCVLHCGRIALRRMLRVHDARQQERAVHLGVCLHQHAAAVAEHCVDPRVWLAAQDAHHHLGKVQRREGEADAAPVAHLHM